MPLRPAGSRANDSQDVTLLLQSRDDFLKCPRVDLHSFEQNAMRESSLWSILEFPNKLQALGMERVLRYVAIGHEEHPACLMDHKGRCPSNRMFINDW